MPFGADPLVLGVIDAHHHVWDLERVRYPWLTPDLGVLYRSYSPADLDPLRREADVEATVVVQAADSLEDTEHMLEAAETTPWIRAVVGWVPLDNPAGAAEALERLSASPLVRGVRTLIQHKDAVDWLLRESVLDSLSLLSARSLLLEVPADPHHLPVILKVARRQPDLTIVIDHLANPPVRRGGWDPWASDFARCAELPNVYAKISGFGSSAGPGYSAEAIRPFVDHAFAVFGSERLMLGSDWPVCLLSYDYATTLQLLDEAIAGRSLEERADVGAHVAKRLYFS